MCHGKSTLGPVAMPKPILVVEDNPYDREFVYVALDRANLLNQSAFVSDGAEALDYLFRRGEFVTRPLKNPLLIILDLKLPKVDGLEVLEKLRKNTDTAQIPIVMLTSSMEEKDIAKGYDLGVNAFIVKPYEFGDLTRVIAELADFWTTQNEPPARSNRYIP